MKSLRLALATVAVTAFWALVPEVVLAEPRGEPRKGPELSPAQLELGDVQPVSCVTMEEQGCDWVLPQAATASLPDNAPRVRRVHILGLTLCSAPSATGPACEIAWVPPTASPAAPAWRDWPEMRLQSIRDWH